MTTTAPDRGRRSRVGGIVGVNQRVPGRQPNEIGGVSLYSCYPCRRSRVIRCAGTPVEEAFRNIGRRRCTRRSSSRLASAELLPGSNPRCTRSRRSCASISGTPGATATASIRPLRQMATVADQARPPPRSTPTTGAPPDPLRHRPGLDPLPVGYRHQHGRLVAGRHVQPVGQEPRPQPRVPPARVPAPRSACAGTLPIPPSAGLTRLISGHRSHLSGSPWSAETCVEPVEPARTRSCHQPAREGASGPDVDDAQRRSGLALRRLYRVVHQLPADNLPAPRFVGHQQRTPGRSPLPSGRCSTRPAAACCWPCA